MNKERIDILVPEEVLEQNPEKTNRLEKTHKFEPTDRAPVVVDEQIWALLDGSGQTFSTFTNSPRDHLRGHLINYMWRAENIRDDQPIKTQKLIVEPHFGALRGTEFPIRVNWMGDNPPKSEHLLTSVDQIDDLVVPEPDGGFNAMIIEWYHAMKDMVDDFDLRLNGEPIEIEVTVNHPGGPIPSAFALCGPNLFLWMASDPDRVHKLMEVVTKSHHQCIQYFDDLVGRDPEHPIWLGCDTGEMISGKMFQEFVIPYYVKIWEQYPRPRIFHMCGKINHLLEIIRDDMEINFMDGFGFPVPPEKLQAAWSGRVVMRGGPHPTLIHDGPAEVIRAECERYLRTVGSKGGYVLSEGNGIMPNTPYRHIEAMVEASKNVGPWKS